MSFSATSPPQADTNPDDIIFTLPGVIRLYRSGRVERLFLDDLVPPSLDPLTGVQSKDVIINPTTNLSARLYLPPTSTTPKNLPILLTIHGGGFCLGHSSSSTYHNYLNSLTAKAGIVSVSVDYRLAPEHPLPAAYDDCWEALQWVFATSDPWIAEFGDSEKVFVAGESAGANIVHNLGMRLGREGRKVEGLAMVHSFFWGKDVEIRGEGKMMKAEEVEALWLTMCPETTGLDDPRINPVAADAPSLAGLGCRRVLVCVAEMDFLRDRGRVYYDELKRSGWEGEAEFLESEGEDHCFFFQKPGSLKGEEFMGRMVSFFNKS